MFFDERKLILETAHVGLSARLKNWQKVLNCKGYIITGISYDSFGMFQGCFKSISSEGPKELKDKVKQSKKFVTHSTFLRSTCRSLIYTFVP